jgi:hypothetical protein
MVFDVERVIVYLVRLVETERNRAQLLAQQRYQRSALVHQLCQRPQVQRRRQLRGVQHADCVDVAGRVGPLQQQETRIQAKLLQRTTPQRRVLSGCRAVKRAIGSCGVQPVQHDSREVVGLFQLRLHRAKPASGKGRCNAVLPRSARGAGHERQDIAGLDQRCRSRSRRPIVMRTGRRCWRRRSLTCSLDTTRRTGRLKT